MMINLAAQILCSVHGSTDAGKHACLAKSWVFLNKISLQLKWPGVGV